MTGSIEPSCALTTPDGTTIVAGALDSAGTKSFSLGVDCNVPYTLEIASDNGAFTKTAPVLVAGGSAPFVTDVAYTLDLTIPTDGAPLTLSCASADLLVSAGIACRVIDSGTLVSLAQIATATVSWTPPMGNLLGGDYQDKLTVTATVKP